MCEFMNGASSDDAVSIQKMITPNMGFLEPANSEHGSHGTWLLRTWLHGTWLLRWSEHGYSEHGYYEVTWNPVTLI